MATCLVTTGVTDFWPRNDDAIVFLGPWCLRMTDDQSFASRHKNENIVPLPWQNPAEIQAAGEYCWRCYGETLSDLFPKLNEIHGVNFPLNYWRILIGPWLVLFIEILYSHYSRIKLAFDREKDIYTFVLPDQISLGPTENTNHYLMQAIRDESCHFFHLKMISGILKFFYPGKCVEKTLDPSKSVSSDRKRNIFSNTPFRLKPPSSDVVFYNVYFGNGWQKLFLRLRALPVSIGEMKESREFLTLIGEKRVDHNKREKLQLSSSVEFRRMLYHMLPETIPVNFIENFSFYQKAASASLSNKTPKMIASSVEWLLNDGFKFYSAEAASRGSLLVEMQHGGGLGQFGFSSVERISLEKNIFYSWGWTDDSPKVKPLPDPRLSLFQTKRRRGKGGMVFIGVAYPLYQYRFIHWPLPDHSEEYFHWKKIFFDYLRQDVRSEFVYRPNALDRYEERELLKEWIPRIPLDPRGSLADKLQRVKLAVIDYISTPLSEALIMNVPTICFWNENVFAVRSKAKPYFDELRKVGILFGSPQEAAAKVNEIYPDIESWWKHPDIQRARRSFCSQFALATEDWAKDWIQELKGFVRPRLSSDKVRAQ